MILFVNSIITFFIIILFCIIIICVGMSKKNFFLFLENISVIKYLFGDNWCKNKKLFLFLHQFKNIYLLFRFYFLSIYFKYEFFIKIWMFFLVYLSFNLFFIQLIGVNQIHRFNYNIFISDLQHLDQSSFLLESFFNTRNNELLFFDINYISYYIEKNIIFNTIDFNTNTFNFFLGTNDFLNLNDETNVKLLTQTVIQNEDLKEAIYLLPSATQEEILSGDMYRLNHKDFSIEKSYEFKVITKKKILSTNELFRWKVLYRHVDEIDLGVNHQKNMNIDIDKAKDQVNQMNTKPIHDLFDKTISIKYENYYFNIFLKNRNIDLETLTIEQKKNLMKEFKNELDNIYNFSGSYEEKTKKICEISNIKYKNVSHIEKHNHVKIKILEMDTSHENIKKCNLINKSGIVFNNHIPLNISCFKAVNNFINKIK